MRGSCEAVVVPKAMRFTGVSSYWRQAAGVVSDVASAVGARAVSLDSSGPIYKVSYDLSYDYRNFIVRSTYDSD